MKNSLFPILLLIIFSANVSQAFERAPLPLSLSCAVSGFENQHKVDVMVKVGFAGILFDAHYEGKFGQFFISEALYDEPTPLPLDFQLRGSQEKGDSIMKITFVHVTDQDRNDIIPRFVQVSYKAEKTDERYQIQYLECD